MLATGQMCTFCQPEFTWTSESAIVQTVMRRPIIYRAFWINISNGLLTDNTAKYDVEWRNELGCISWVHHGGDIWPMKISTRRPKASWIRLSALLPKRECAARDTTSVSVPISVVSFTIT